MKKVSIKYIIQLLGASIIVASLLPIGLHLYWTITAVYYHPDSLIGIFIISLIIEHTFLWLTIPDIIWLFNTKKHLSTFKEKNLSPTSAFNSSNMTLYIDLMNGKVAAIAKFNPFVLQIIDATDITNPMIDQSSIFAIFGRTKMVGFCFDVNGKRCKIPTFASNHSYSLKSGEVNSALSKANLQVIMLMRAQERATKMRELRTN